MISGSYDLGFATWTSKYASMSDSEMERIERTDDMSSYRHPNDHNALDVFRLLRGALATADRLIYTVLRGVFFRRLPARANRTDLVLPKAKCNPGS